MLQFYFLSIIANVLGGLALSSGYLDEHLSAVTGMKQFFDGKPGIRVSIGVIALIAGVLKLLTVTRGDVPVIGDLVPALVGMLVGIALIFERYKETATAGRGKAALLDDESALIKDLLVLTFGEDYRADIENLLDFEY